MLRNEQERTGRSIEEAADLIKASLPFHNPAGGDGRRRSQILRLAPSVGNHGRHPQGRRRRGRDYRVTETMLRLGMACGGGKATLVAIDACTEQGENSSSHPWHSPKHCGLG
jgi:hypothetical protein